MQADGKRVAVCFTRQVSTFPVRDVLMVLRFLPIFAHSCEIKSGSCLGMRLASLMLLASTSAAQLFLDLYKSYKDWVSTNCNYKNFECSDLTHLSFIRLMVSIPVIWTVTCTQ